MFAPQEDAAYATARSFTVGTALTAVCAAIVAFAILPQISSFAGFCAALGLVLVPAGALSAQPWQPALFTALEANFVPLLAPSNPMTYDQATYYNTAMALLAGIGLRHAGLSAAAADAAGGAGATAARAQPAGFAPPQPGRGGPPRSRLEWPTIRPAVRDPELGR